MKRLLMPLMAILLFIACKKSETDLSTSGIKICNQVWMLKNLEVTTYRNGDPIPQITDSAQWSNLTTGAWCYNNNDPANGAIYGKLYNWFAVNDPRGLAPAGWHVPSDAEWGALITCQGSEAGGKLKEKGTAHWFAPNTNATNESGFTGLPGGLRDRHGYFAVPVGYYGFWWTSEQQSGAIAAYSRYVTYANYDAYPDLRPIGEALSVRCIAN